MAVTSKQSFLSYSSFSPYGPWDVYLSFRGEDTRSNFISHLYAALVQAGLRTFIEEDDLLRTFIEEDDLPEGVGISSELLNVIRGSKMSIVVFSKNYASSRWCLEELAELLECKKTNGQLVIPVYYHVEPGEVRRRFGEAFDMHTKRFVTESEMDKVNRWRAALTEIADMAGYNSAFG